MLVEPLVRAHCRPPASLLSVYFELAARTPAAISEITPSEAQRTPALLARAREDDVLHSCRLRRILSAVRWAVTRRPLATCASSERDHGAVNRAVSFAIAQRTCFRPIETASRGTSDVLRPATALRLDDALWPLRKAQFARSPADRALEQVAHLSPLIGFDQNSVLGDRASMTFHQPLDDLGELGEAIRPTMESGRWKSIWQCSASVRPPFPRSRTQTPAKGMARRRRALLRPSRTRAKSRPSGSSPMSVVPQ